MSTDTAPVGAAPRRASYRRATIFRIIEVVVLGLTMVVVALISLVVVALEIPNGGLIVDLLTVVLPDAVGYLIVGALAIFAAVFGAAGPRAKPVSIILAIAFVVISIAGDVTKSLADQAGNVGFIEIGGPLIAGAAYLVLFASWGAGRPFRGLGYLAGVGGVGLAIAQRLLMSVLFAHATEDAFVGLVALEFLTYALIFPIVIVAAALLERIGRKPGRAAEAV